MWILLIFLVLATVYNFIIYKTQKSRRLTLDEVYNREDLQIKYSIGKNKNPKDYGFDYEDVEFLSKDGLKLKAWYIKGGEKSIIFSHGRSGNRLTTLEYLELVQKLNLTKEYSILLYDMRNGGESPESKTGIGECFKKDVYGAIKFMESKNHKKGIFWSFSLGAMGTLMALEEYKDELNFETEGFIFDSPLTNARKNISYSFGKEGANRVLCLLAPKIYNVNLRGQLDKYRLSELLKNFNNKILIFQSKDDTVTPYEFFEEEIKFIKNKELQVVLFDEGPHLYLRNKYRESYDKYIVEYFGG